MLGRSYVRPERRPRKPGMRKAPVEARGGKSQAMPFGKYEGFFVEEVPLDYLHWFAGNVKIKKGKLKNRILSHLALNGRVVDPL